MKRKVKTLPLFEKGKPGENQGRKTHDANDSVLTPRIDAGRAAK